MKIRVTNILGLSTSVLQQVKTSIKYLQQIKSPVFAPVCKRKGCELWIGNLLLNIRRMSTKCRACTKKTCKSYAVHETELIHLFRLM